jgi:hypothetical protein
MTVTLYHADYCDMAERRITGDAPLFADVRIGT